MYEHSRERLGRNGWQQYELSSFSKTGHECRHNQSYWSGDDYFGLRSGSFSIHCRHAIDESPKHAYLHETT